MKRRALPSSAAPEFATSAAGGRLDRTCALASDTVTTIIGFTEVADGHRLYNSAAIFQRGTVVGLHRKLHSPRQSGTAWVIRADVAGRTGEQSARQLSEDLLIAKIAAHEQSVT